MANKKITELTELTSGNIANNDVFAIVDVGGDESKKVTVSSLYDIFDNNVTIDTAKIIYGLTGANTNISALSVNTLPLIGGTVTGTTTFSNTDVMSINAAGNVKIARGLAVGYANKVPGANLDVKGNAYISGATTIAGTLTLSSALGVGQGGTGATSLTDGGVLLGSGTNAVTAMGVLGDGEMIVGDGATDPVAESGATLRTSIGVGTGDSPQFTAVNIGNASDTTVSRSGAGDIAVEGNIIYRAGGTDVPVTDGGTGASSLTDGGVLFGSGTSAITASPVLTDGVMLVGDGSTDPALEGNTTLRTSIGIGTGDIPNFWGANTSGNVSVGRSLAVGYTDGRVPQANLDVNGNVYISGALAVTEIDSASTITLDAETDIVLDAKGGDIFLKDNGTLFATLTRSGGNLTIKNGTSSDTALTFSNDDTDVTGKLTSSVTPSFNYGANATGNISVTRGIAVGYTDGKVPGANLDVKGNAFIGSTLAVTGAVTSGGNTLQTEGDVLAYAIALG